MTEQDLSLLTDKEREHIDEMITHARFADHVRWLDDLRQDLHTARAENKRKDDALRKVLDTLIWASGAFQSEKESSAWSRIGLPVVNDLRALLQSEKGE